MKSKRKNVNDFLMISALILLFTVLFTGCDTTGVEESQLPWSEPQPWEGAPPGFGSDRLYRDY